MINNSMKCINCKFCHQLKELINNQVIPTKSICIALPLTAEGLNERYDYNTFCLAVDVDDCCELFYRR